MSSLRIQFERRNDGGTVLRCIRADGTVTWQRTNGRQGAFFPIHDLTHYAVETVLGTRQGFFGLVAVGWDLEETNGKGARGPLPDETLTVEHLVGLLNREAAAGTRWTTEDINRALTHLPSPRPVTDGELATIRAREAELLERWRTLPPDGMLELPYTLPQS
jgi:hypothetical protein